MRYSEFLKGDYVLEPEQIVGVDYLINHRWVLLGDDMGVGKSIQSLTPTFMDQIATVIVCPSNLKINWKREIEKFAPTKKQIRVIEKKKDILDIDCMEDDYIIVSYKMCQHMDFAFELCECWIFDEAHHLKSWGSDRSRAIRENAYSSRPQYLFMLTGTPITKTAEDWLNYLFILSRCPWGTNGEKVQGQFKSPEHFANTFCEFERSTIRLKKKSGGRHQSIKTRKYIGLREENLPRLEKLLEGKYIRRESADIQNLPSLMYKEIILSESINEELESTYNRYSVDPKFNEMYISEIKEKNAYVKTRRSVAYATSLYDEVRTPIIIFTDHPGAAIKMCEELRKRKYTAEVLTGTLSQKVRQKSVDRFMQLEVSFLIATIGSSNTGYNFTMCRNIVFNDLSWRYEQNEQAIKRIHRKGQEGSCMIHTIIGDATDGRIAKILLQKKADIRRLI